MDDLLILKKSGGLLMRGNDSLVNQTYFFSFYIRTGNIKGKK